MFKIPFLSKPKQCVVDHIGKINGTLTVNAYDADGKFLWKQVHKNLVVNDGREQLLRLAAGDVANRSITKIGFGTSSTPPTVTDTALTGSFVKAIGVISYPSTTSMLINWTLGTSEGNGAGSVTYYEFGLICNNNKLFSRLTRSAIVKTSAIQLVGTWQLDFNT